MEMLLFGLCDRVVHKGPQLNSSKEIGFKLSKLLKLRFIKMKPKKLISVVQKNLTVTYCPVQQSKYKKKGQKEG